MRQLILPGDRSGDARHVLDGKTSRYLVRVLRMGRGDSFQAMDEAGNRFRCEIEEPSLQSTVVALSLLGAELFRAGGTSRVRERPAGMPSNLGAAAEAPAGNTFRAGSGRAEPAVRLALVQALPKGQKMDLIVRQAVEAGVSAIFPILTSHCVSRERSAADMADKLARREKIVREALQQSGSAVMTKIHATTTVGTLADALAAGGFGPESSLYLMCHELPLASKSLHEYCAEGPSSVVILVGPEGGFSPEETEAFVAMDFKLVHFEGTILRSETAALFALAATKTILTERTSWTLSK